MLRLLRHAAIAEKIKKLNSSDPIASNHRRPMRSSSARKLLSHSLRRNRVAVGSPFLASTSRDSQKM
ncbi:hypothetical protein YC2023_016091 [Brassica napus]